eukprot:2076012-Pyramimonas_sp.AAC.1
MGERAHPCVPAFKTQACAYACAKGLLSKYEVRTFQEAHECSDDLATLRAEVQSNSHSGSFCSAVGAGGVVWSMSEKLETQFERI